MNRTTLTVVLATGMLALFGGPVSAGLTYYVAPSPNTVSLEPSDFITSLPQGSGLSSISPNPVIGDNNIGSNNSATIPTLHPGAFNVGAPDVGGYFVGVFGVSIDTSTPNALNSSVYLWETSSGSDPNPFAGPQI